MNLLIEGDAVVTMGPKGTIKNGAIVVEGDTIVEIGKARKLISKYRRYEKIGGKGKVIIPGLVNTHHHAAMSILRGYADDMDLRTWLERQIWPMEKHMTSRDNYVGALLTAVESIMGGVTTVNTMYHYTSEYNEARAFAEAGIRGVIGHVCFSWRKKQDRKALELLAKTWHTQRNGRLRASVDPHAPYTVDPEYMKELKAYKRELSEKYASEKSPIIFHTHVAETIDEADKIMHAYSIPSKGGVVEYLDSLEVLSNDVVASHCVHLTNTDMEILKERNVKVAHNPVSNLKLGSGICPLKRLLENGITVGLGTDSSCSNNSSDMFEVMKITALLHKGITRDPTMLPADQILRMATIEGAKTLLWSEEIGSIRTGKKADVAIVDFKKPHLTPVYNETSHLVYAAKSSDVDTVIVNGELLMENREVKTLNTDNIISMAEKTRQTLMDRVCESL
ncbi:MAG: amidohydrolase [Candidatus Bathyarchaeota archaeon]|nr:MAG: amidohydrolase [Candidatus Bathyarchaeota archaeon]